MTQSWYPIYTVVFAAAFLLALILTPFCMMLARRTGYLDVPESEGHKLHDKATPLLGGFAMFMAWSLTLGAGYAVVRFLLPDVLKQYTDGFHSSMRELLIIFLGAAASMTLGLIDDKHPMKAWQKFLGQFVISLCVVLFGNIRITCFLNSGVLSVCLTVFWFLFLFNAINFFDNMDGLAAGTSAIAFFFFAAASVVNGQYFVAVFSLTAAAATCGFWVYNSAPAKIFMGDSGSHFLAFLLAITASKVTYYDPAVASTKFAVLIPLFVLAVPIFDTFAVVVIRLWNHKPVYVGDHNHISHRFLHMGMTRARAVQMVHLLALIAALGALPLLWGNLRTCFVLLVQGCCIFLLLTVLQYAGKKE